MQKPQKRTVKTLQKQESKWKLMQASRYLKYFQSPLEEGKAKKKVPFWKLTEKERVEKYRKMKDLKKPKIRVLSGKQWQEQILIAVTKYDQMMQNEAEEMTEKPE